IFPIRASGSRARGDLVPGEKVGDLTCCCGRFVRAVDSVFADARAVELANRPLCGLGWVGRTDDLAVFGDRVLTLEGEDKDGAARHKGDELVKEASALMLGVEAFGFGAGEVEVLHRLDDKAFLLEASEDGAGMV